MKLIKECSRNPHLRLTEPLSYLAFIGTNLLAGNDPARIPDKWDGNAAERIVADLLRGPPVIC